MNDPISRSALDRIAACGVDAGHDELARELLHAYVACLTPEELCEAAIDALNQSAQLLGAIRTRLLRIGHESEVLPKIESLATRLMVLSGSESKLRTRIESLLSHIYSFLSPPTRQVVLDHWRNKGTRGSEARWLKAIADDELLFGIDTVLDYWRLRHDWRAARLIVYRATPQLIDQILPELIERCDEGWIVARAVLRSGSVSDDTWAAIRAKFPATYAYLCAKTRRSLNEHDALAIIDESDDGATGNRGLAIWAIGQLGMVSVLDRVWTMRPEFERRAIERLGMR
jgi:hypothetical protein